MSLLWERTAGATHYEVRQAGRSLRLYTNGVLHSQYNPARPLTGSVWDLLFLPVFFYPPGQVRRVLVLGVGGGAVIQQLRRFVRPERIVGVDLNAVHLSVARRFFAVKGRDVQLVRANAVTWVSQYRGAPFDLIIDDLFSDVDGEPQRAVYADRAWVDSLRGCLSEQGMIVANFASRPELMMSAYLGNGASRPGFHSGFYLSTGQNYNAVGVFLNKPATTRQLRERLRKVPQLDPRRRAARPGYRIRTLKLAGVQHD
ncbi:MAG TPA: methyltransferase domain-containing protein [Gammaproteobacteria bacterium]|nr:methyltransferase domain-containing protein [Gammaproteobacteria bacterium]